MRRLASAGTIIAFLLAAGAPAAAQAPRKPPVKAPAKPGPKKPAAKPLPEPPPPPPPPPPPDLAVTAKYVTGDKTTTSRVFLRGAQQRIEYEADLAAIQDCAASLTTQLNTRTRVYLESPMTPATSEAPAASGKHKGGAIHYTTAVLETSERKEMFGFEARRVKTTITKDASADACDKKPEKVEIDGWYIELPPTTTCLGAVQPTREIRVDAADQSCSDEVTYVRPPASPLYPVAYTMVTTAGTSEPATTTMETADLKRMTVEAAQFQVPSDYVPVRTMTQLTADHRPGEVGPKKAGVTRVGVAPIGNKSGQPVSTAEISQALLESLGEVELEVVMLKGDTPAALEADAQARSCDYILQNTVAEVKRPGKSMLGKISGSSGESFSAKVEYALVVPGSAKAAYAGSERSGTSMLQTAVAAAKRVSQFFPPLMMARYGYLNAFTAMSGTASAGTMTQTPDPVLSTMFALVDRATAAKKTEVLTTEDGAVAAALEREVQSVVAQLKRKKS